MNKTVPKEKTIQFAVVNPFPGHMSAELELVMRIQKAAENIGHKCYALSNEGYLLDEEQKITKKSINPQDLEFVITTHYLTMKTMDAFYYHTLWNPPEIPLGSTDYWNNAQNYLMNDDYLIYDTGGMSGHLKGILMNKPRDLDDTSTLVGSFPLSSVRKADFDDLKLFYCGMNWDKLLNGENRHGGLFKLLDDSGCVKFFGPDIVKAWGNIRPWEGYKSYQYSIPFDGFSILEEINKCGVVLVLSSDVHRRAGAATNRLYEAIAGGAVIISDDNEFIRTHFHDAALFIDYNIKNPQDTFNQIMEKYNWVKNNPREALNLVEKAQKIFEEKFCLEKQLSDLIEKHPKRVEAVKGALFAKDTKKRLLLTLLLDDNTMTKQMKLKIDNALENYNNQIYENIELIIAADTRFHAEVKQYVSNKYPQVRVMDYDVFNSKNVRIKTEGQILNDILKRTEHDYFLNMNPSEVWFYDHVTTLIRAIEDCPEAVASYSGRLRKLLDDTNVLEFFNTLTAKDIFEFSCFPVSGQVLFAKEVEAYMDDYLFDCLDGMEHYAYLLIAMVKQDKKIIFSKRMTLSYYDNQTEYKKINQVFNFVYSARYFQDIVRYDMNEKGLLYTGNSVNMEAINHKLAQLPIKPWLKLRSLTVISRFCGFIPGLSGMMIRKRNQAKEEFERIMNIIN
jgi:hypothetical protein